MKAWLAFLDESGFLMAPLVRRTWSRRGETPVVLQRTRSYQKVSAIAALCVSPDRRQIRLYFRLHPNATIKTPALIDFLRQLQRETSGLIVLLWDRLKTHRARRVQQFLGTQATLRPVFFPPYAPDLNPIEYAWGYLKMNPLANWGTKTVEELTIRTRRATKRLQRHPQLLQSFLRHSPLSLRLK